MKGSKKNSSKRESHRFQIDEQERERYSARATSFREIADGMDEELKKSQSYVEKIKEVSLKFEGLGNTFEWVEISEKVHASIIGELRDQLSITIEELFKLRESVEVDRTTVKSNWAKEKKDLGYTQSERLGTSQLDADLSSLTIWEELSDIERCLSLIKDKAYKKSGSKRNERTREGCQQRLDLISKKWLSIRRSKIEQIMNRDVKAMQLKENIKEVEARFAVGELDPDAYEYRISDQEGALEEVEKEISDIRDSIFEIDTRISRCSELLEEDPEGTAKQSSSYSSFQ